MKETNNMYSYITSLYDGLYTNDQIRTLLDGALDTNVTVTAGNEHVPPVTTTTINNTGAPHYLNMNTGDYNLNANHRIYDWNTINEPIIGRRNNGYGHGLDVYGPPQFNTNWMGATQLKCYPTSEGRISEKRKEIIYKFFELTKVEYGDALKHLGMDEYMFNTLLLEYAMDHKRILFMQLMSRNNHFSGLQLYNEVVKIYK